MICSPHSFLMFRSLTRFGGSSALWRKIQFLRQSQSPIPQSDRSLIYSQIMDPQGLSGMSEKHLSLTLSMLLDSRNIPRNSDPNFSPVIKTLVRTIVRSGTTLQGCNQILGSFAKLKTNGVHVHEYSDICEEVFGDFRAKFLDSCPNRELSNIFWAACILGLKNGVEILANRGIAVPQLLESMDCVDISLICAGLMDKPEEEVLWSFVVADLKNRKKFTSKDIPSIMCSIACAGISDPDLARHLTERILGDKLLTWKNAPGIVWAVSTYDFVHFPLLQETVKVVMHAPAHAFFPPLDIRRMSRAFAVSGKLDSIETWLMNKILSEDTPHGIADSVLIWELATNGLVESALKLLRSRPIKHWKDEVDRAPVASSQLYSLYLASLAHRARMEPLEEQFLLTLQSSFSDSSEKISSSVLHRQASDALKELKIEHVSEYKEPVSGFVVDMFIPSRNMAIEVQGPSHYLTDLVSGQAVLRPADKLKHRVLQEVANMKVIQITPWNFGPKIRVSNTVLMKKLLDGTGGFRKPPPPRRI